jgi:hypothetical protein
VNFGDRQVLTEGLVQNRRMARDDSFLVARNPDAESKLPFLLAIPIDGALFLKARDSWPRSARVYCHPLNEGWPSEPEILEQVAVKICRGGEPRSI